MDQEEGTVVVTLASQLDYYRSCPTTLHIEEHTIGNARGRKQP